MGNKEVGTKDDGEQKELDKKDGGEHQEVDAKPDLEQKEGDAKDGGEQQEVVDNTEEVLEGEEEDKLLLLCMLWCLLCRCLIQMW